MKPCTKGHQRSRLRVDPFILLQLLTEQHCTLSELQQRTGFDPAELKLLRAARKIHLDTLNRIAAGLNVPPDSLLIAPGTPWSVHDCDHGSLLFFALQVVFVFVPPARFWDFRKCFHAHKWAGACFSLYDIGQTGATSRPLPECAPQIRQGRPDTLPALEAAQRAPPGRMI